MFFFFPRHPNRVLAYSLINMTVKLFSRQDISGIKTFQQPLQFWSCSCLHAHNFVYIPHLMFFLLVELIMRFWFWRSFGNCCFIKRYLDSTHHPTIHPFPPPPLLVFLHVYAEMEKIILSNVLTHKSVLTRNRAFPALSHLKKNRLLYFSSSIFNPFAEGLKSGAQVWSRPWPAHHSWWSLQLEQRLLACHAVPGRNEVIVRVLPVCIFNHDGSFGTLHRIYLKWNKIQNSSCLSKYSLKLATFSFICLLLVNVLPSFVKETVSWCWGIDITSQFTAILNLF